MNGHIEIVNWSEYQHYTYRNPPWIKLHSKVLDNYEYGCLPDASKLLLISLWMLASKTGNKIPYDLAWISAKSMIKSKIDLEPLEKANFINIVADCVHDASMALSPCKENGGTEKSKSRVRENTSSSDDDGFDVFWLNYPKKIGKGAARRAWKKIKSKKEVLEKLKSVLPRQKQSEQWTKENGQFIPNPATYLNQGRWEDETI